jgi:Predicted polymerase, most proteins contain PALM domain, HD hydrolase domain and Zn-ribbon domain
MNTGTEPAVQASAGPAQEPRGEEPKPEYSLQVSTDSMTAYLRIKPAYLEQKISYEEIVDFLRQNGIEYGICEDAIRSFCEGGKFFSELICARGIPPVDGTDGVLNYNFNTDKGLKPKEREDGTVDFRDLGMVQNVSKGDVLCSITPSGTGTDGMDIYNHVVPFKQGRMPVLPVGSNTVVSEDQLSLLAEIDGCIEFLKTRVNVNDVFIVRGNVDSASGNIVTGGSVIVQGDVRAGFSVQAGQNITVRGMVEGAMLEARGSISISNGMNGMGKGTLKAGGNIVGKYFENAVLFSENDVYADILMNCRVEVGGSILLKGQKASLIGGAYQVGKRIFLKNIGTAGNAITRIVIESKDLSALFAADKEKSDADVLNQKLANAQKELDEFQKTYENLTAQLRQSGQSSEKSKLLLKSSILKKSQLTEAVEGIKKQVESFNKKANSLIDFNVVGTGIIYPGTKISIGPYSMNINTEYSNTKFYADQERIIFGPVLPSDIA